MEQSTILILIALILFVQSFPYTLYPRIVQGMKKKTYETYRDEELPPISIVVPTYNEERAIRKKLESLLELDYPSYDIIVVDSASTDRTQEIIREFVNRTAGKITLLTEEQRRGKISAINCAVEKAGSIVVVTDANAFFDSASLKELIKPLKDPSIYVTGAAYETSSQNPMLSYFEKIFRSLENKLARLESAADSTFATGELFAFKKSMAPLEEKAIVDDAEASIKARKMGYRAVITGATVYEETPSALREFIAYKSNRAFHTLKILARHKNMLFNPYYGTFGLLIFPSRKLIPMLSPLSTAALLVLGVMLFATLPLRISALLLITAALLSLGAKIKILQAFTYQAIVQLALVKGWIKLFTHQKLYWEKVR